MSKLSLKRQLDRAARLADRLMGEKATLTNRSQVSVDIVTGEQTVSDSVKTVRVRAWPLTLRDAVEIAKAGLVHADTRWTMRVHYASEIEPGDLLEVAGFLYEVVSMGATKDEFDVEWIILTQRRK